MKTERPEEVVQAALDFLGGRAVMVPGAPKWYRDGGVAFAAVRRVVEIAGRFHAAYNTDDGVEFHGAEELTLDELNVAFGEALDALMKENE